MKMKKYMAMFLIALIIGATPAFAVQYGEITADPTVEEKANIEMGEEFDGIYIDDGYVIVETNPIWKIIPIGVIIGALKAAGVAITTSTIKAATILKVAGQKVSRKTVSAVLRAWPTIRRALIKIGEKGYEEALKATVRWVQGKCIKPFCGRRTPDGSWGDVFCSVCARRFGQSWA